MAIRVTWLNAVCWLAISNCVLSAKLVPRSDSLVPLKHVESNVFQVGDGPGPFQITNQQMVVDTQQDSGGSFMDFFTGPTEYLASMLTGGLLGSSSSSSDKASPPPGPIRKRPRLHKGKGRLPGPPFGRGPRFPPGLRHRRPLHPGLQPFNGPRINRKKPTNDKDGHWTGGFSSHFKLFEKDPSDTIIVDAGSKENTNTLWDKKETLDVTVNEVGPRPTVHHTLHKPFRETETSDKSFTIRLPHEAIDTRGAADTMPPLAAFGTTRVVGDGSQQINHQTGSSSGGQTALHDSFNGDFIRNTRHSGKSHNQFNHHRESSSQSATHNSFSQDVSVNSNLQFGTPPVPSSNRQPTLHNSFSQTFKSSPPDKTSSDDKEIVHKWEQWGALIGKQPTKNSFRGTSSEKFEFEKTVPSAPTTLQTIYNNMVSLHKTLTGNRKVEPSKESPKNSDTAQDQPSGFFQGSYSIVKAHDHLDNIDDSVRQKFVDNSATPQFISSASVLHQNIFSHIPNDDRFTDTASSSKSFEASSSSDPTPSRYNQEVNDQLHNSGSNQDQKESPQKGKLHSVADVVDALKIVADALENTAEGEKIYLSKFAENILDINKNRRSDSGLSDIDSETSSYTSYKVEPVSFVDLSIINGSGDHLTESSYSVLR